MFALFIVAACHNGITVVSQKVFVQNVFLKLRDCQIAVLGV